MTLFIAFIALLGIVLAYYRGVCKGHDALIDEQYDCIFDEARKDGYDKGYQEGLERGYQKGTTEGRETGYKYGLETGKAKGFEQGKKEGAVAGAIASIDLVAAVLRHYQANKPAPMTSSGNPSWEASKSRGRNEDFQKMEAVYAAAISKHSQDLIRKTFI